MTLHFLPARQITTPPNRQRREFKPDELNDLADSIEKTGLLHPIVVREEGDATFLVAGERRFRAMQDLHDLGREFTCAGYRVTPGEIPCTLLRDLSPLEAMEAEFEENIRRVDLTWQEKAMATAGLMKLRQAQSEAGQRPAPTIATISAEVRPSGEGVNHETTRREIILAQHLDDPEVKSAKSVDEAFKTLRKRERAEKNAALAESVGQSFSNSLHAVYHGDSLEWLRAYSGSPTFDVILTDPPYGLNADKWSPSGVTDYQDSHTYEDSPEYALQCYTTLAVEGFRITSPQAHAWVFLDIDMFPAIRQVFRDAGWKVFRTPITYISHSSFRAPWGELGPQRKTQWLLFANKGDKPMQKMLPDYVEARADAQLNHPAQKPVGLLSGLLARSVTAGQRVLDPFAGTGGIFPAAHSLLCSATGIELDQTYYGICLTRIGELS